MSDLMNLKLWNKCWSRNETNSVNETSFRNETSTGKV